MRAPIGPKWLSLLVLAFGALEIPWVGYLFFSQARTGVAQHIHLAAIGLIGGAATLAAMSAVWLWKGQRLAAILCVMAGTWMAVVLFFALTISSVPVVLATIPGLLIAAVAAGDVLRHPEQSVARWLPVALLIIALVLLVRLTVTLMRAETSMAADHLRFLIVLYDAAEVVALIGLGVALRAGRPRAAIVLGSMAMVLFLLDGFVNLVVVGEGEAFVAALFYAVVGEIPSVAMSAAAVVLAMRRWTEVTAAPSPDAKMGA